MKKRQSGQAVVEYLLVLVLALIIISGLTQSVSNFLGQSFGSLGHYLTMNLSTGICQRDCFFSNYENGFQINE